MRSVRTDLAKNYSNLLGNKGIPPKNHYHFQKWLRYYLDFCHKYQFIPADKDSLPYFVRKLHEKNQTMYQQKQASHAIGLYYELITAAPAKTQEPTNSTKAQKQPIYPRTPVYPAGVRSPQASNIGPQKTEHNQNIDVAETKNGIATWDAVYWQLKNEINVRHYSINTFKTYSQWIHQFQAFVKNKAPQSLKNDDVKRFLTFLAVKRKVAASTQNQALNSVLFMFRHIICMNLMCVRPSRRR